jgi:hypothetical protein
MAKATQEQLMAYIAQCAESIIEDDMNESGDWTDKEHDDLVGRALAWCSRQHWQDERQN